MLFAPGTFLQSLYSSVRVHDDGSLLEVKRGYLHPPWIPNIHRWLSYDHWISYLYPIPTLMQIRPFPDHWNNDQRLCSMFFPVSSLEVRDVSADIQPVQEILASFTQILNTLLQFEGSFDERGIIGEIVRQHVHRLSELLYFQTRGGQPVQPAAASHVCIFDDYTQQYMDVYMNLETGWIGVQAMEGLRCGHSWFELGVSPMWTISNVSNVSY